MSVSLLMFLLLSNKGLDAWHYASSDTIEKARIDTQRILSSYEKTKDPTEIRSWLISGPTEAPSAQMVLTFARWGLEHKKDFVIILEGLSANEQTQFAEQFCGSLGQSGTKEFKKGFEDHDSKAIGKIQRCLSE